MGNILNPHTLRVLLFHLLFRVLKTFLQVPNFFLQLYGMVNRVYPIELHSSHHRTSAEPRPRLARACSSVLRTC